MVKITFKTLQQKQFQIDVEPTETIGDVKAKIEKEHGWAVANQKIIFSGKILTDDKVVQDANIKEKDFCVVMVTKPKAPAQQAQPPATPAPAPATAPSTSTSSTAAAATSSVPETPATSSAPASEPAAPARPAASSSAPATSEAEATPNAQPATSSTDDSFVVGSALESSVNEMVAMGFPRDQVMRALRAAFNNPHRAVEYLMNGIPESANPPPAAPSPAAAAAGSTDAPGTPSPAGRSSGTAQAPAQQPQNLFEAAAAAAQNPQSRAARPAGATGASGAGATAASAGQRSGNLDMERLRQEPLMQQLRQLVQQNPALLQPFLQQIAASNPALLQLIDQHQNEFIQFLQEGTEGEGGPDDGQLGDLMDQFGGMAGDEGDDGGEGGAAMISVTEEERAAIDRLCGMGFDRNLVIQAYIACDKNEELAANYLLEHGFDDD